MGELLIEAFKFGLDIDGSAQRHVEFGCVDHERCGCRVFFSVTEVMVSRLASLLDNAIESRIPFSDYVERKCIARRGSFDARTPHTPFIALLARSIAESRVLSVHFASGIGAYMIDSPSRRSARCCHSSSVMNGMNGWSIRSRLSKYPSVAAYVALSME